jgi:hypothetical protein
MKTSKAPPSASVHPKLLAEAVDSSVCWDYASSVFMLLKGKELKT